MPLKLTEQQLGDLSLLSEQSPEDVIDLCKAAFEYLSSSSHHHPQTEITAKSFEILAEKNKTNTKTIQRTVEALVSLLIEATKTNSSTSNIMKLEKTTKFSKEILHILTQFATSKRGFIEGSIKSANLRSYRIMDIEWRLESKIASRCLLKQNSIFVTMKLYLHTEPKNENRDLLPENENNIIHPEERRNRKDILVQTDLRSLLYIIQTLEDALMEAKSRRIRNIVDALAIC